MVLTGERNRKVYLGAGFSEHNPINGPKSVYLTSNKQFTHGLFLGDISYAGQLPQLLAGVLAVWLHVALVWRDQHD